MADLSRDELSELTRSAGLAIAAVTTPAVFETERQYIAEHIARGHTRGMDWFTAERANQSADPRTLHDSVRSVLSVGVPFWSGQRVPPNDGVLRGRIARYAWGRDYHKTLRIRMKRLVSMLGEAVGRDVEARTLSDTARAFDRAIAARSGAGWTGKNSMIIVPGHGSWVMLGELYLDLELAPDLPLAHDCGRCMICLHHCPTEAIVEPYRIDAPRCISYLTIEERGSIDRRFRPQMGTWVFGCDQCQDVCPYTNAARVAPDQDFEPATIDNMYPSLEFLAKMDHAAYVRTFAGTAVVRAKRRGLARNAAVALGNSKDPRAEPILREMLTSHDEPLARGHAAWGLAHLTGLESRSLLLRCLATERVQEARQEIELAIQDLQDENRD